MKNLQQQLKAAEAELTKAEGHEAELKQQLEALVSTKVRTEFNAEKFTRETELAALRSEFTEAQNISKARRKSCADIRLLVFGEELKKAQARQIEIASEAKVASEKAFDCLREAMTWRQRVYDMASQEYEFLRHVNREFAAKGLPLLHERIGGCIGNLAPSRIDVDLVEEVGRRFRDHLLDLEYTFPG